jgi:hypothetical protein
MVCISRIVPDTPIQTLRVYAKRIDGVLMKTIDGELWAINTKLPPNPTTLNLLNTFRPWPDDPQCEIKEEMIEELIEGIRE